MNARRPEQSRCAFLIRARNRRPDLDLSVLYIGCGKELRNFAKYVQVTTDSVRDDDPRRFTLFTSSVIGDARLPADTSLLLLPRSHHP